MSKLIYYLGLGLCAPFDFSDRCNRVLRAKQTTDLREYRKHYRKLKKQYFAISYLASVDAIGEISNDFRNALIKTLSNMSEEEKAKLIGLIVNEYQKNEEKEKVPECCSTK